MKIQFSAPGITVYESALMRTTATVIYGTDYALVVDPNWLPQEVDTLARAVKELDKATTYLLFTHSDYDHIIGYGRFPGATTVASHAFTTNPDREATLEQIRQFDDDYYLTRTYPITYPAIDHAISGDGTILTIGDDEYVFYQAPGHNRDGLITHVRNRGILMVGDYLCNVEFPFVYHSFREYRITLDKLERLINTEQITTLIVGHGDHTHSTAEMTARLAAARRYLDELEEAVVNATDFDLRKYLTVYGFPRIMRKFHAANVELLRKELQSGTLR